MAMHDQRIAESSIFFNSIEGLQAMLGRTAADYGQPPIPVISVAGDFAYREISRIFNNNWKYPFMAITIQSVVRNNTGYNNNLRRIGVSKTVNNKVITHKLTPVVATFRVRYYTQDNAQQLRFAMLWLNRQKDMQYKLENNSIDVNIQVRLDDNLNIPTLDTADWGNIFQFETSCEVYTYIGEVETTTKINKVNVSSNLWDTVNKNVTLLGSRTVTFKSEDI